MLLLNFSNQAAPEQLDRLSRDLLAALAEGSRYHGYRDAQAQPFDLDNPAPVQSTIEDWRIGSGPDGKDLAKPWTIEAFAKYRSLAPDCMGPWLVYWRQNFPGLDNRARDDSGRPMKNWWPFLFY